MSSVSADGYRKAEKIQANGVRYASGIRQAGAVAMAIANATEVINNYRKMRDISDRSLKIAESEREHVRTVYWPRELQFLKEFGTPEAVETAEAYGRRFAGRLIAPVAKAFAEQVRLLKCNASRYCSSAYVQKMQALYQAQASAIANAKIMGYILGFNYAQAWKDLNDERRRQAIGLGKGLFGQAASLYQSALGSLATNSQNAIAQINNAIEAFGDARRATINSVPRIEEYFPEPEPGTMLGIDGNYSNSFGPHNSTREFFNSLTSGLDEVSKSVMDTSLGGLVAKDDENTLQFPYHNLYTMQEEGANDGIIGNTNLVRNGTATYSFTDSRGDRGSITVNMADFGFGWIDNKWPNIENDAR